MSAQHTPGPWRVAPDGRTILAADKDDSDIVAMLDGEIDPMMIENHRERDGEAETEANARLIAAAPDMLATLKSADDWLSRTKQTKQVWQARQEIGAAIAKAEGKVMA